MKTKLWLPLCSVLLAIALIAVNPSNTVAQSTYTIRPLPRGNAVALLTRYDVKETYRQEFRRALHDYVLQSLANKSNIMAEAYYEQEDPSVFWVIERWHAARPFEMARRKSSYKAIRRLAAAALSQPARVIYVKDLEPLTDGEWRKAPGKTDQPLAIMLFVDAKPGTEQTFRDVYHIAMPQFRTEPGVITYQLSALADDAMQFVTYEKFRNEAAFQYHLQFPPIQPVIRYLNTSIKEQPFQKGLHRLIAF